MGHLSKEQRYQLEVLQRAGKNQTEIGRLLGCNQSTVSRELGRNSSAKTQLYRGHLAQERSVMRRQESYLGRRWYEREETFTHVMKELRRKLSPDQITGRMKQQGWPPELCVSCQSVYNYIRADRYAGGKLYKNLRYQGKKYKWRGWNKTDKTRIPNRRGIEERPLVVAQKKRAGDWESDLIVSSRSGRGAVATFVERTSMYLAAELVPNQSAEAFLRASQKALGKARKHLRLTLTHDNGKEICFHEQISKTLGLDVFCARPYCSSDRGLNEFMNRELRRFFPKGTDFASVSNQELAHAVAFLNNLPRRSLNFQTPNEVFMHLTF